MSVRVLANEYDAVIYDSTTMRAFPLMFSGKAKGYITPGETALKFVEWCEHRDLRLLNDKQLEELYVAFYRIDWHRCGDCQKLIGGADYLCEKCMEEA